jgi:hypothetical protein
MSATPAWFRAEPLFDVYGPDGVYTPPVLRLGPSELVPVAPDVLVTQNSKCGYVVASGLTAEDRAICVRTDCEFVFLWFRGYDHEPSSFVYETVCEVLCGAPCVRTFCEVMCVHNGSDDYADDVTSDLVRWIEGNADVFAENPGLEVRGASRVSGGGSLVSCVCVDSTGLLYGFSEMPRVYNRALVDYSILWLFALDNCSYAKGGSCLEVVDGRVKFPEVWIPLRHVVGCLNRVPRASRGDVYRTVCAYFQKFSSGFKYLDAERCPNLLVAFLPFDFYVDGPFPVPPVRLMTLDKRPVRVLPGGWESAWTSVAREFNQSVDAVSAQRFRAVALGAAGRSGLGPGSRFARRRASTFTSRNVL